MNDELLEQLSTVLEANRYMVLGTTQPDGTPRVSPVYFTHEAGRTFFWVSSPEAQHSQNIAARPEIELVVFDSSVPPAQTAAVYVTARAEQVPDAELAAECDRAFRTLPPGGRAFAPEELRGGADLRLYRARAMARALHIRGSDPTYGTGTDRRLAVPTP